jgi:molybdopterin-guanine dinucleotide biosynthesis protein A
MGSNKALLPFMDEPLIARIIRRLTPMEAELFLVSNQPELFEFLDVPVYPDILPGKGPLGGLLTALTLASQPAVANIACDMPFVNPELLIAQMDLMTHEDVDVVIPRINEQYEPMHAIYRRETCLPQVRHAIQEGSTRMISWFQFVRVHPMDQASIQSTDPQMLSFTNVNTPEEFIQAEVLARKIQKTV